MVRQKMFYTGCSSRLHDLEDFIYEIDKKLTLDLCFVNWNTALTHVDGESGSELEILKYIIVGNQYMTHNT